MTPSLSLQAGLDRRLANRLAASHDRRPIRAFHPWHAGRVPKRRLRVFSLTSKGEESKSREVGCSIDHVARTGSKGWRRGTQCHTPAVALGDLVLGVPRRVVSYSFPVRVVGRLAEARVRPSA